MDEKEKKWFEEFQQYNTNQLVIELNPNELNELTNLCKTAYEKELHLTAKNLSDEKWLQTALQKGTLRDRANAGALLFQNNPFGNLAALDILIGLTKAANKASIDIIDIISELFIISILPSSRKLLPLSLRGSDWNNLKNMKLEKNLLYKIYSFWYFEAEVKERYFKFIQNLDGTLKIGKDVHKCLAIVCVSNLLSFAPEKEQMLLMMLINKLGDPQSKVSAKAQHHLSEVAYKHPNMCEVIVKETERMLFRTNISERAQHCALTFLAEIAIYCNANVCEKLVSICFVFFKILVDKGMVNNKTMQAILRCLRRSIKYTINDDKTEIITKELQDVIYRLVHFATVQTSIQALGLLLEIIINKPYMSHDRYYNALYKRLIDIRLLSITHKWSAQFLYIIHRSIALDSNIPRAQAFLKRLLQLTLYFPAHMVCGVLIIINKLLLDRPELNILQIKSSCDNENRKFDKNFPLSIDDDEKYYDDVSEITIQQEREKCNIKPSWLHANMIVDDSNDKEKIEKNYKKMFQKLTTHYDPFYKNPAGAGAEYELKTELLVLEKHFHPTVKNFTKNIFDNEKNPYYGDPLVDFSLTNFLERFAFKNPKKESNIKIKSAIQSIYKQNKSYKPYGSRGRPVTSLSKENCSENENFIFQYLEKRREHENRALSDDSESVYSVDDDEFNGYLDSLGAKKFDQDIDMDYMKEIKELTHSSVATQKKKPGRKNDGDECEDLDENQQDDVSLDSNEFDSDDFADDDSDIDSNDLDKFGEYDESDNEQQATKKIKMMYSEKEFNRKLKEKQDMASLFASADDFADLLTETGKIKNHGTIDEIHNKDKSSEKQLKWEQNRMNVGKVSKKVSKIDFKNSFINKNQKRICRQKRV